MRSHPPSDLDRFLNALQWFFALDTLHAELPVLTARAFHLSGYPPSIHLEPEMLDAINAECKNKGSKEGADLIRSVFNQLFSDHKLLSRFERTWKKNTGLDARWTILSQILEAHRQRHFFVACGSLITQITGVLLEFLDRPMTPKLDIAGLSVDLQTLYLRVSEVKCILPVLNARSEPTTTPALILSGIDLTYGTQERAMRLLVLFDQLQYFLVTSNHAS